MEIQVTDFENAAFSVFMVLVTRAILSFDLNFYIPIRKVDENMERAHALDAVLKEKFYFRKNLFPPRPSRANTTFGDDSRPGSAMPSRPGSPFVPVEEEYAEMTVNEIINGSADGEFPGLVPIVESYLDSVNVDVETRCQLATYLDLVSKRASGELNTAARWIRDFVDVHPEYKHDSVVSPTVNHDLIGAVIAIGERESAGRNFAGLDIHGLPKFLGRFRGGCGSQDEVEAAKAAATNGSEASSRKRKSEWMDGAEPTSEKAH
jgi:glutamate--cysteine ligase catalytic subunit